MAFLFLRLMLLAALLAVLGTSVPAHCDPAPARTVEGIATTQVGKPAARVTLYLFGLPPGQTDMITLGEQSTVVTDDQGRFTWNVPAALPPLSDYIGVRSIACYALAADRGTERFRVALRPDGQEIYKGPGEQEVLEQETRPCETKWLTGGAHPIFSVVVPDTAAVSLTVGGPNGKPLPGQDVEVVPSGHLQFYEGAAVYTSRTDAVGRLRLRCFPGSLQFLVLVPGIGFGATGTFDAEANQSVTAHVPPLAPFAILSGTVILALLKPGATVALRDALIMGQNLWYAPSAAIDAAGHWTLTDVLPGQHRLVLTDGRSASEPVQVTVRPGERKSGIVLTAEEPAALLPIAAPLPISGPSVRGRVTDPDGRPAAGADVFAVIGYFEGSGYGQRVLAVKTDAAGLYVIPGLPVGNGQKGPSVHLVARLPGFGLAVADGQSEKAPILGCWQDIEEDLVLPKSHSELMVRVLQNGKPAASIRVALTASDERSVVSEFFHGADRGEAAQALRALLSPSAQTGPDGTARFADLTPGLWNVTANRAAFFNLLSDKPLPPSNDSAGVIVQAGKSLTYTVSLVPPPAPVTFHVLGPDGFPIAADRIVMISQTAHNPNYGNLQLAPDSAGDGRVTLPPGLYKVTARYGEQKLDINVLAGPYFEGTALIAVSPAAPAPRPVVIPTQKVGPASLRVRLQDTGGQPLRGTVTVGGPFNPALYAATIDADGMVIFPNMPQNFFPYTVTAHIAGRPERAALRQAPGPLPTDDALSAEIGQPMPQTVRIRGGEEATLTFGRELPGYVRLRLIGPLASQNRYYIEGRQTNDEPFTEAHFNPADNEYILGPLPAGRRTFHLFRNVPPPVDINLDAGEITLTVQPGQVVHATLTPQSTAALEAVDAAPLLGTVYLPDGKTPAWGARAALFIPTWVVPRRTARADTQGRLTLNDFWDSTVRSSETEAGSPAGAVVAAWLPGANGAVIVPFVPGRDQKLILPPSVSLHGRVTVGGQTVTALSPSQFQVRAAYQGKGRLNAALSVDAAVQADGTFTLAGLTLGTYQVQAARDDVWLSKTQIITVGADALSDMTLDIAPPGSPVILSLVDRQGKPQAGQSATIVRPNGPLTGEVWPRTLTADNAGRLRVDGLEAGHHLLMLPGQAGTVGFDVPAWSPAALPAAQRIVLPAAH